MKTNRYTKSRLHEKLSIVKKMSCVIAGLFLASTTIVTALAKDNSKYIEKYETISVERPIEKIYGTQQVIEIHTLRNTEEVIKSSEDYMYIRCTVYCDTGYTASGDWTTHGCLAGKREWLGKQCKLYKVNKDGSKGEYIGTFTFKDTGFGLDELDGVYYEDGTIKNGASIDMWHPTEEQCWSWVAQYGDYVYMEFVQ